MSRRIKLITATLLAWLGVALGAKGESTVPDVDWMAGVEANVGNGNFAPYYISALNHGKVTQSKGLLLDAGIGHRLDTTRRFSWAAYLELCAGAASKVDYVKWTPEGIPTLTPLAPPHLWLQQLYAQIKYRGVFLEAGLKEYRSALLDNRLTSGDMVESGNARPIPQIRAGFIDFQNIPFTHGWLQIQGEIAYGRYTDNNWLCKFYSYASSHINTGSFYIYRRAYFRTKPSENLCFTFGMQAAGEIGGTTVWYSRGQWVREEYERTTIVDLLKNLIPYDNRTGVGEYYSGNNLGSWDLHLRYRIPKNGGELRAYLQKPWEKGSSIGWLNGFDGLWGLQYNFGTKRCPVEAVLFEYLYLMNQSGSLHYAPHDFPGSTLTTDVGGGDQYYNNAFSNAYVNYGMGIGSPFLKAPLFNTDGYPQYTDNRMRGFHFAALGHITESIDWRLMFSYRQAFGDGRLPRTQVLDDFSWMIEGTWRPDAVEGMRVRLQLAMDRGSWLGNNFGVALSACYRGNFNFRRK